MTIINSTKKDIDEIFRLYQLATDYMQGRSTVCWPPFERSMVEKEIAANHQWKMIDNNKVACVWATTFTDPLIWEERNDDPAVYIHRIATNPDCRGKNLVLQIVEWAKEYAIANNKKYIRLDTVGENKGLIKHYQYCGFTFLGLFKLQNTAGLPAHYDNASVSLFEIAINQIK
jgi:ribosomal protein S18 acetylase RimI-like enzyme